MNRHGRKTLWTGMLVTAAIAGISVARAQTAPGTQPVNAQVNESATQGPAQPQPMNKRALNSAGKPAQETNNDVIVPAGTKILLGLRNGINTKSAQVGDGVYLASTFPVVVGDRVAIPAGVYVQGVIDRVVHPGHIAGRAQVSMHFTTMIFPNGSVATIPGVVGGLPGAKDQQIKDKEGTIEQSSNKGKDVGDVLAGAAAGTGVGGIAGAASGHPGAGLGLGAAAGGVGGLLYTLFTRNNDIMLEQGQSIEMVLERPLTLTEANLSGNSGPGLAPAQDQPQPMQKPKRTGILCPFGSLGCN